MLEPENPSFLKPYAPTIPGKDSASVPTKHDFSSVDCRLKVPKFTAKESVYVLDHRGKKKKQKGKYVKEDRMSTDGGLNLDAEDKCLSKNNLSSSSRPDKFVELFILTKKNAAANGQEKLSTDMITKFTNLKPQAANAGMKDGIYPDF